MCGFFNGLLSYWYVFVWIGECFCVHVKWLRTFLTQLIIVTGLLLAHILSLKKVFYNIPQRKINISANTWTTKHVLLQIIKRIKALNNPMLGQKISKSFYNPPCIKCVYWIPCTYLIICWSTYFYYLLWGIR